MHTWEYSRSDEHIYIETLLSKNQSTSLKFQLNTISNSNQSNIPHTWLSANFEWEMVKLFWKPQQHTIHHAKWENQRLVYDCHLWAIIMKEPMTFSHVTHFIFFPMRGWKKNEKKKHCLAVFLLQFAPPLETFSLNLQSLKNGIFPCLYKGFKIQ